MTSHPHLIIRNYQKRLIKDGILTIRLDEETQKRLFRIVVLTRRSKSDLVREAIFDLIWNKYKDLL